MNNFRTQLAQWLIDDSTNRSHVSDIPMKTTAAQRSTAFPQNDTHHPHEATTSHREREEKGDREESEDGDDEEGERAGNPGSDPGTPQREDQ